jgi:hypothetical protein
MEGVLLNPIVFRLRGTHIPVLCSPNHYPRMISAMIIKRLMLSRSDSPSLL